MKDNLIKYSAFIIVIISVILVTLFFNRNHNLPLIKEKERQISELQKANDLKDKDIEILNLQIIESKKQVLILKKKDQESVNQIQDIRSASYSKIRELENLTDKQADSLAHLLGDSRALLQLKFDYDTCKSMLVLERGRGLEKIIQAQDLTIQYQGRIISNLNTKVDNLNKENSLTKDEVKLFKKRKTAVAIQRDIAILGAGVIIFLHFWAK
jgi:hypothetical protein